MRQYAAAVYQQGGSLGDLEAFLSSKGPQELLDRASSLEAVGAARNRTLQRASATSVVADTMRRQAAQAEAQQLAAKQRAEQARSAAQAQADAAVAATARIQNEQQAMTAELAKLRNTSVALERERQDGLRAAAEARAAAAAAAEQARLAAARAAAARTAAARQAAVRARQEAARQAAAARAAAEAARRAATHPTTRPSPRPQPKPQPKPTPPPPPSTGGGVSAVLSYARAQIGKPYQWGGTGPDSFDCSGLTMMAWRQAGVYLSHYTGAQWSETDRVPISDLQPGDLVFYGVVGREQPPHGPVHRRGPDDRGPLHRRVHPRGRHLPLRPVALRRQGALTALSPHRPGAALEAPHPRRAAAQTSWQRLLLVASSSDARVLAWSVSSAVCATGGLASSSWFGMRQRAVVMPASAGPVRGPRAMHCSASSRPAQCAPSTDLPGSRSL